MITHHRKLARRTTNPEPSSREPNPDLPRILSIVFTHPMLVNAAEHSSNTARHLSITTKIGALPTWDSAHRQRVRIIFGRALQVIAATAVRWSAPSTMIG